MGIAVEEETLKISKKVFMKFILDELSLRIHYTYGPVGFIIKLNEEEGFFSFTVFDTPLEFLDFTYENLREKHTFISKRIEFEPCDFNSMTQERYLDLIDVIFRECGECLTGN